MVESLVRMIHISNIYSQHVKWRQPFLQLLIPLLQDPSTRPAILQCLYENKKIINKWIGYMKGKIPEFSGSN